MANRTDLINHLINKCGLTRYLEIGVQVPEVNFLKIDCKHKTGVDPCLESMDYSKEIKIFGMYSDDYFNLVDVINEENIQPKIEYDIIFIDGLHTAEQVRKDFENSLKVLSPNGFIVLHDCNPLKEEHTIVPRPTKTGHWNGDVYKFAVQLASNWANYKTIDLDNGCGVFHHKFESFSLQSEPKNWDYFDKNRKELLNLISWEDFQLKF